MKIKKTKQAFVILNAVKDLMLLVGSQHTCPAQMSHGEDFSLKLKR